MKKPSFEDTKIAFSSRSDSELNRMYWLFRGINSALIVQLGEPMLKLALKLGLPVKGLIKKTIFQQFCGGETIGESMKAVRALAASKIGSILDYSVEGEENESSFEETKVEIIRTIEAASGDTSIPFSVFKVSGLVSTSLLAAVQERSVLESSESIAYAQGLERVDEICRKAFQLNVPVMIDAEESWIQEPIDAIVRTMMERYNLKSAIVYNTVQLYRHDRLQWIKTEFEHASAFPFFLGLKLVRGAYMEKERERAKKLDYPSPIQASKNATDTDFNEALRFCLGHSDRISIVSGTHNEESCKILLDLLEQRRSNGSEPDAWFAQLLGMSDNLSFNLAASGYKVAKYLPYGPVKAVMPYLFRRAEENTAIAGQMGRELSLILSERQRRASKS